MTTKFYLVTGGTGFVGSALVRRLLSEGHSVRVLDDDSRGSVRRLADLTGRFELVRGDVRDAAVVAQATRGVDAVCHLAFVNGTEFFYTRPELVLDVGVKGIVNVLDACIASGVRELILVSSSEVYQEPPVVPTNEHVPLSIPDPHNPRYSYAAGKIISEIMAINYGRKHFDRVLIVRPHNVWGKDMGFEHVIPEFVMRVLDLIAGGLQDPLPFRIQGTGEQTRAFVFIDDFIDGLVIAMRSGEHLGIYNVGTTEEIPIATLAHAVADCFGRTIQIVPSDAAAGGTSRRCPDIKKLAALGYAPKIKLRQALADVVAWYTEHARANPRGDSKTGRSA